MENEQETIKINNYDISMLIGLYFLDKGTTQLGKLAELIALPENDVELVLNEYRESPQYRNFYSEICAYSNQLLDKQDSEVLSNCLGEAADLMNAFYVMNEQKVSPATILNEGHADKLFQSAYFTKIFGKNLMGIAQAENTEIPGWKRLMAETALMQDYSESIQAMKAYTNLRRTDPDGVSAHEADYRQMVAEAFARAEESSSNYMRTFNRPFLLPEVESMRVLYETGNEEQLLNRIMEKKNDELVIGKFAEYLCGSSNRLTTGFPVPSHNLTDRLADAMSQTAWFGNMVGYDLSGVCPEMMTHAQFELARNYAVRLTQSADGAAEMRVNGLAPDGNVTTLTVNPHVIHDRMSELFETVKEGMALTDAAGKFVKGEGGVVTPEFFESQRFKQQYGEDLSLFSRTLEPADVMVMETYRKALEMRTAELAHRLVQNPTEENMGKYRSYVDLTGRLEAVECRLDQLYESKVSKADVLAPDMNIEQTPDRAVMLLYEQSEGRFLTADAGAALDESAKGYSVIDRYTTAKQALDFVRLVDQKIEKTKSGVLGTDSMRNEYKVFRALPSANKDAYLSVNILSAEAAAKSEHPDLTAMRAIAFEYEKKVAFDLVNPGVADVIKTDANRAEYQEKMDKDAGGDRCQKSGTGRSMS